jgi:hypothetical protein
MGNLFLLTPLLFLASILSYAAALKESDFRNSCSSAAFCRRQRQSPSFSRGFYFVEPTSVESRGSEFTFVLVNRRSTRPLSAVITTLDGRFYPQLFPGPTSFFPSHSSPPPSSPKFI